MEGRIDDDLLRTGRIDGVRQLIRVKRPMNCSSVAKRTFPLQSCFPRAGHNVEVVGIF
jgi:hypothetical protein